MLNEMTVSVGANMVCMLRADTKAAIVLLESEPDALACEQICHKDARPMFYPRALEVLGEVKKRGTLGVCGFTRSATQASEDVFIPESGDVVGMLIDITVCDDVARFWAGNIWVRGFENEGHRILTYTLHELRKEIGDISNAPEPVRTCIHETDWQKIEAQLPLVIRCFGSQRIIIRMRDIVAKERPRGVSPNRIPTESEFVDQLLAQCDPSTVERDGAFFRIREWERQNASWPVLRTWRELEPFQLLLNQRYWKPDLLRLCERADFRGGFCAFKLDLDNFKGVNTALGHAAGDEAICYASKLISLTLNSVADIYRRGGDEFVALASNVTIERAASLAEDLRASIERGFRTWAEDRGLSRPPTASIGLVYVPARCSAADVERLLDETQDRAKKGGKNKVETAILEMTDPTQIDHVA